MQVQVRMGRIQYNHNHNHNHNSLQYNYILLQSFSVQSASRPGGAHVPAVGGWWCARRCSLNRIEAVTTTTLSPERLW